MSERDAKADQYARKAAGWSDAEYADGAAYLAHRAELVATLGVELAAGDEVCDLACGDGGLGEHLVGRGLRYVGVDSEPAMVEAARSTQSFGLGRFASTRALKSCSPIAA